MQNRHKKLKIGAVDDFHHFWYLLIWDVYLSLYYLAEHLIVDNYWVSYLPIDDAIPFCRFFIIPYCMWHPLLVLMTVYLFFYDVPAFKRFMLYIGLGFGGSIIFCMLFPNGQDLRPTSFAQNDFFTWLVQRIYAADTNTNVIPSMHVIGCAALTLACFDAPSLRRRHLHIAVSDGSTAPPVLGRPARDGGGRGHETLVTVTFAEHEGGKTRMTFRQAVFDSVEQRDGHQGGWNSAFDRLAEHVAGL